jgi:hypothetical protein
LYFNSVGERVEDGSVGIRVDGTGVGEGPSVGGGPSVSGIVVLTIAVISTGVEILLCVTAGVHELRNITRTTVKVVNVFIVASLSLGLEYKTICSP